MAPKKALNRTKHTRPPTGRRLAGLRARDGRPSPEQYRAYVAMFDYFNRELFQGAVPDVLLAFSGHARSGGYYADRKWQKAEATSGEIALNPKALSAMEPEFLAALVVHEMTHAWQFAHGTPGRRGYHNREWADRMEALGLQPSATGHPGGKRTGGKMSHYVLEGGPFQLAFRAMPKQYLLPWLSLDRFQKAPPRDPSKTPYTCPACEARVWGKPELVLLHVDCDQVMLPPKAEASAPYVTHDR
jgi:SprT-like family